jgi:hypothetical protein
VSSGVFVRRFIIRTAVAGKAGTVKQFIADGDSLLIAKV